MAMRRPVDSALEAARAIVDWAEVGRRVPATEELAEAIRRYEEVEFDVPDASDSDGFLFQYGPVNWYSEPTFTVGFVRQLEIVDSGGGHDSYLQIQFEYRYRLDPEAESLGSGSSWWFRSSQQAFSGWLESAMANSVWNLVRERRDAAAFEVSQELT
jgi:hypothetical protein